MIELYFTTGCFRQMGYVTKDGVTKALKATKFYDSIQEAEANLRDYLLAPPQISWLKPYIQEESSKLLSTRPIRILAFSGQLPCGSAADEMNKLLRMSPTAAGIGSMSLRLEKGGSQSTKTTKVGWSELFTERPDERHQVKGRLQSASRQNIVGT